MPAAVTVAIPVLDGGELLGEVLAAVTAQRVNRNLELLVCDSGSRDGSAERAAAAGARVLRIPPAEFSHAGTRNRLVREARGEHVAFLTQDATPADDRWLQRLLDAFAMAEDVALVSGSYRPRPGAPVHIRRELEEMFAAGGPRMYRAADVAAVGPATFHSDANGMVARAAWERVPFPDVPYAEDQALASALLRAGYSRVFVPDAAVLHSHDYGPLEQLRRSFDEFRALRDVHCHIADAHPYRLLGHVRGQVRRDRAYARARGLGGSALDAATLRALGYHAARATGAALGARAATLPSGARRRLSRDGRP